jgi:hypothetical protein
MRDDPLRRRLRRLPPAARRRAIEAALNFVAREKTPVAVRDAEGKRLADTAEIRAADLVRRGKATWVTRKPPLIELTRRACTEEGSGEHGPSEPPR